MTTFNTISADRADFAKALAFAKRGAVRNSTIPILGNVLIRAKGSQMMLHTTDLDRRIMVTVPLTQPVKTMGMTLPAYKLDDVTRKAKASTTVEIAQDDACRAAIKFGDLKITMNGLDVSDFPTLEMAEVNHEFTIPTTDLLRVLTKVRCAISTEETRYYLNGVYMHQVERKLRFVATDGHRLTLTDLDLPVGADKMPGVVVPRLTVEDLLTLLKAKGVEDDTRIQIGKWAGSGFLVSFVNGNVTILSKMINGTFPAYDRVIPQNNDKVVIADIEEFSEAIKEVSCINSERGRTVKLSMARNRLTVSVFNPDVGTAARTITVERPTGGEPMEIGFNAMYLLDLLACLTESKEATIKLNDPGSPILVSGEQDVGFQAVLMPMRV